MKSLDLFAEDLKQKLIMKSTMLNLIMFSDIIQVIMSLTDRKQFLFCFDLKNIAIIIQ